MSTLKDAHITAFFMNAFFLVYKGSPLLWATDQHLDLQRAKSKESPGRSSGVGHIHTCICVCTYIYVYTYIYSAYICMAGSQNELAGNFNSQSVGSFLPWWGPHAAWRPKVDPKCVPQSSKSYLYKPPKLAGFHLYQPHTWKWKMSSLCWDLDATLSNFIQGCG